jgi:hypothetical protein
MMARKKGAAQAKTEKNLRPITQNHPKVQKQCIQRRRTPTEHFFHLMQLFNFLVDETIGKLLRLSLFGLAP